MLDWFKNAKNLLLDNFFTKLTAVFVSGTIGHKVAVIVGILGIVVGIWKAFVFLLISLTGIVILQMAIRDFEANRRSGGKDSANLKDTKST